MNDRSTTKARVVIERIYRAQVGELWDLWTTKAGFESWWGPIGFRVEVHAMEPRPGGAFHYDMIADAPEQVAGMKQMGRPVSHETHGKFSEFKKHERLVLTHVIDFLPGIKPYESTITVEFFATGGSTRMVVTLDPMHDENFSKMQTMGFTSQLSKLDARFEQAK